MSEKGGWLGWPALFVLLTLFWGCDSAPAGAGEQRGAEPAAARVVRADATFSANVPERPERIVSMAPSTTEMLFALGAGERVVGVTRYCDFPEAAHEVPKIGGMLDPDLEAILAARPDLVVGVQAGADHAIADQLDTAGVAYAFTRGDDLAAALHAMELLGGWIGEESAARELRARTEREIEAISHTLRQAQGQAPLRVLMVYDREPVVVAGPGSFGAELLALAGLENAVSDVGSAYPVLDMEAVIEAAPEVVIDVSLNVSSEKVLGFWQKFESLPAVANDRVVHLPDAVMMRPGPRVPRALERLGEATAPETRVQAP